MTGSEEKKIGILAEAARYDASCSTAGSDRKNTATGMGTGAISGICHAWSDDGRCVALLKVLFSNACAWDCAYCANRRSNDVDRASFAVEELVRVIVEFYKRNYIEGVFLSSGVLGCPDTTMDRLVAVARRLRLVEGYNGYIHMKAIPGCSDALLLEAARWADRISVNIELPSSASLAALAPEKSARAIFGPMRALARARRELGPAFPARGPARQLDGTRRLAGPAYRAAEGGEVAAERGPGYGEGAAIQPPAAEAQPFMPAGQTTQMVVGASPDSDRTILVLAENLYKAYDMRRVYYSAYIPVNEDSRLPCAGPPPLLREHRLYQADWLFRFYGFAADEIVGEDRPNLDAALDPKAAWALRHLERFPLDPNRAAYEELLRVPGIGPGSVKRILRARRGATLREVELRALGVVMKRAWFFLDWPGKEWGRDLAPERLRPLLVDGALAGGQLEFEWAPAPRVPNIEVASVVPSARTRSEAGVAAKAEVAAALGIEAEARAG